MELVEYIKSLEKNNYKVKREYETLYISSSHDGRQNELMSVPVCATSVRDCNFATNSMEEALLRLIDITAKYVHTTVTDRGLPDTGMYRIKLLSEEKGRSLGNKYLGFHGEGFTIGDAKGAIILDKEEIETLRENMPMGFLIDWNDFEPVTQY